MSENILNQTKSAFTCVGTVYEKSLTLEPIEIDAGPKDNKKRIQTQLISGPVSIRMPNGIVNYYLYVTEIGYNGKDNFQWNMAVSAMNNWEPEINGNGEKPTKVMITGELNPRDYTDKNTGALRSDLGFRIKSANTRVGEDAPEGMTIKLDAFVHGVKHEEKNDEETGRLILNLLIVDYNGKCFPVDCFVEEDGASIIEDGEDDFEAFEVGQTRTNIELDYRVVSEKPAVDESKSRTIGKGSKVKVHDRGKITTELVLCAADITPIEEPEDLEDEDGNPIEDKSGYINPVVMKKALKIRDQMLEELKNNPPEKKKGNGNSFKDKKAKASKSVGKANKPSFDIEEDPNSDPF